MRKLNALDGEERVVDLVNQVLFGGTETTDLVFTPLVKLDLRVGRIYSKYTQTGDITFSQDPDTAAAVSMGTSVYHIIANGSSINFPAEWIDKGRDALNLTGGAWNVITVTKINDLIFYFILSEE